MIENDLQAQVIEYIKSRGFKYRHKGYRGKPGRGHSKNDDGWPDLEILIPGAKTIFIELKVDNNTLSEMQIEIKLELQMMSFSVYECRTFEKCVECIEHEERKNTYYGLNNG